MDSLIRDIAQLGRAPALGAGCRRFKSYYPDFRNFCLNSFERILISEIIEELLIEFNLFFILCSCNYDLLTDFL
jgi:hypothetical protein